MSDSLFMVFDVESVGLHGEGFAAGWVVVNAKGETQGGGLAHCPPENARGSRQNLEWVKANVGLPEVNGRDPDRGQWLTPREVRDAFWRDWMWWKAKGARLAADVAWPVEARFLAACIDDDLQVREWDGPYPLIDIASVRFAAGLDPLGTESRREDEQPAHHPGGDAKQSARLLCEALSK